MQYICLLIPRRDVDTPFIDNKGQNYIASSINALDNSNLLTITQLNKIQPSAFFYASNNFYRPNYTYLEASFIKVIDVFIINTILSLLLINKSKLPTNYLRIFLEYSLVVLYLVIYYLKLIYILYKSYQLVLTYQLS